MVRCTDFRFTRSRTTRFIAIHYRKIVTSIFDVLVFFFSFFLFSLRSICLRPYSLFMFFVLSKSAYEIVQSDSSLPYIVCAAEAKRDVRSMRASARWQSVKEKENVANGEKESAQQARERTNNSFNFLILTFALRLRTSFFLLPFTYTTKITFSRRNLVQSQSESNFLIAKN